eukprot:365880-Chlamydomonas_euryale.AAC.5
MALRCRPAGADTGGDCFHRGRLLLQEETASTGGDCFRSTSRPPYDQCKYVQYKVRGHPHPIMRAHSTCRWHSPKPASPEKTIGVVFLSWLKQEFMDLPVLDAASGLTRLNRNWRLPACKVQLRCNSSDSSDREMGL